MILVFGGTTEGKQVIEVLETLQLSYVYSTKTAIKVELGEYGLYRFGAFTEYGLAQFIVEQNISSIIHASHPFAIDLHQTIASISEKSTIPVFRLERNYPERLTNLNVHYVNNYEEALTLLNEKFKQKTLLALTGVQTIVKLENFWKKSLSYFRILDRQSSIDIALKSDFPENQLILGYPNTSIEAEKKLIQQKIIEIIITKESGSSGSLSVKIEASLQSNIPIIIIKKPSLPVSFELVKSKGALREIFKNRISNR